MTAPTATTSPADLSRVGGAAVVSGPLRYGSLCSGYGGLDLAVEQVFGALPEWHVEFDGDASRVLATRWPDVPNYGDLTALDWAALAHVDIITAGYPCQPFSKAGKRLGAADARHLWPYIEQGLRILRPRFVVLENVRNHLNIGWDVVLVDLDRLGYDVRWITMRVADIGGCHGRMRLFALGVRRDSGGVDAPTSRPVAELRDSAWWSVDDDLFGAVPYGERPPARGALVGGQVWSFEGDAPARALVVPVLPTPEAKLATSGPDYARAGRETSGGDDLATTVHRHLLPTPLTDPASHNGHGRDLSGEVRMLPTPTARDHKGHNQRRDDSCLPGALLPSPSASDASGGHLSRSGERADELLLPGLAKAQTQGKLLPTPVVTDSRDARNSTARRTSWDGVKVGDTLTDALVPPPDLPHDDRYAVRPPLLPTPKSAADRTSRAALTADGQWSAPSLAQALELAGGELPREYESWDEVRGWHADLAPDADLLLPTPNPFHLENTETPDEWLARRAEVQERTGTRHGPALPVIAQSVAEGSPLVQDGSGPHRVELLPTPKATDGSKGGPNQRGSSGDLTLPSAVQPSRWGPYGPAVERHGVITGRPAPEPTEPGGRGGVRLSPVFVEWMMMLPAGWVTDPPLWEGLKPGKAREAMLRLLGNGVVPPQAVAALHELLDGVAR